MLEQETLAQHRIGRFCECVPLARAEVAVLAKEGGDDTIGRRIDLLVIATSAVCSATAMVNEK